MGVDQPPAIKRPDSDYFCGFLKDAEGGSFARLCTFLVLAFLLTQRRREVPAISTYMRATVGDHRKRQIPAK